MNYWERSKDGTVQENQQYTEKKSIILTAASGILTGACHSKET